MNRLNHYKSCLNQQGEIDEDLVREALADEAEPIDREIAVRLRKRDSFGIAWERQ
jgi:hypothetical protein